MKKKKIVSGITPTGKYTLGNYLGAIKNLVKMQDDYDLYIFVANLHGITTPYDKNNYMNNQENLIYTYLASGLDIDKIKIFYQSHVYEHTLLAHILLCNTTLGELNRMTQFKDKSQKSSNGTVFIPTGLLTYPTLMAADILLYDVDYVIVGDDQKQHIELVRNVAERINNKFDNNIFNIPLPMIKKREEGSRIMNLQNPNKKMSKSDSEELGNIYLFDSPEEIEKKISKAVTDSENKIYYDPENKPGVSNLLVILSSLTSKSISDLEEELRDSHYGELKQLVKKEVLIFISDFQVKYNNLKNSNIIKEKLSNIENEVKKEANLKMQIVMRKMGIL